MCLPVRRRLVADEVSDIEKTRVRMTLLNLVASWIFAADSTCDVGMPDYGKGLTQINLKFRRDLPRITCTISGYPCSTVCDDHLRVTQLTLKRICFRFNDIEGR